MDFAYCYPDGRIEVGRATPANCLELGAAEKNRLVAALEQLTSSKKDYRVPGIEKANCAEEMLDCVIAFASKLERRLG